MTAILTAAEMREIEARAIASGALTGQMLMERAGQGVVDAIHEEWPRFLEREPKRAMVLCGPGNNGGDGFVVARLLEEKNWRVRVLFAGDPERLPPDAHAMFDLWMARGPIEPLTEENLRFGGPAGAKEPIDIFVDAIFGTGLTRPPAGEVLDVLSHMGGRHGDRHFYQPRTVSIDAPSGLSLDSGRVLGEARGEDLHAALTVTFDSPKVGHFLHDGPEVCGKLVVKDIGLEAWRRVSATHYHKGHLGGSYRRAKQVLLEREKTERSFDFDLHRIKPSQLDKSGRSQRHKFDHGHALVLSGPAHRTGAARLAARGALRIGAGLVTVGAPSAALPSLAAHLTAVMLTELPDGEALKAFCDTQRLSALCLGPALGLDDHATSLVEAALQLRKPTVLDADALTVLSREPDLRALLHEQCILTPHGGEFARLCPDLAERLAGPRPPDPVFEDLPHAEPTAGDEDILHHMHRVLEGSREHGDGWTRYREAIAEGHAQLYSKLDATREASGRLGCVVLFKGPDTVIAHPHPNRPSAINAAVYDRAAPWLATAGSGDVLAGFIAGLLSRGFEPFDAACTAAWLHVECARSFGPGLVAEDLPEELPKVFRSLGL